MDVRATVSDHSIRLLATALGTSVAMHLVVVLLPLTSGSMPLADNSPSQPMQSVILVPSSKFKIRSDSVAVRSAGAAIQNSNALNSGPTLLPTEDLPPTSSDAKALSRYRAQSLAATSPPVYPEVTVQEFAIDTVTESPSREFAIGIDGIRTQLLDTPPIALAPWAIPYPTDAWEHVAPGQLVAVLTVEPDGTVSEVHFSIEHPWFAPAALPALRRARFEPATRNGVQVRAFLALQLDFQIVGSAPDVEKILDELRHSQQIVR